MFIILGILLWLVVFPLLAVLVGRCIAFGQREIAEPADVAREAEPSIPVVRLEQPRLRAAG